MVVAKKLIYAKQFDGMPKVTDLRIKEETLPAPNDGGLLIPMGLNSVIFSMIFSVSSIQTS